MQIHYFSYLDVVCIIITTNKNIYKMDEKYVELIESYVTHFKVEKEKTINEIKEYIKYHFFETPESIYNVREYINIKDSAFSQFVILTIPQILLKDIDVTRISGNIALDCYKSAQEVLDEFKKQTSEIYSSLVEILTAKLENTNETE